MNCEMARAVWTHPDGFIAGVRQHMPGVMERLEELAHRFKHRNCVGCRHDDPFDREVKSRVGYGESYYTEHSAEGDTVATWIHDVVGDLVGKVELERYLSDRIKRPVFLGNMCCKSCVYHDGTLDHEAMRNIQLAAVMIDPPV